MTYARLEKPEALHWPCPTEEHPGTAILHTAKFSAPDGLGTFVGVEWKPPAEVTDADYPFILTTGRILFHYHTGTMTRRSPTLNAEVPTGYVGIPLSTFFHQSTKDTAKLLARFAELTSD